MRQSDAAIRKLPSQYAWECVNVCRKLHVDVAAKLPSELSSRLIRVLRTGQLSKASK